MSNGNVATQAASRSIATMPNEVEATLYGPAHGDSSTCEDTEEVQNTYQAECGRQEHESGAGFDEGKDYGWWLFRDLFTPQNQWSELAKLDANVVYLTDQRCERIVESRLKRALDCAIALILLALLMPVLVLLAVIIKLESHGPALFRHSRVGRGGREFEMWKFRSMRAGSRRYERSPASNRDSRLTRVGRIIRRISLDEVPQLWNVLRGEMSLVGPRPEMAFIVDRYNEVVRKRLSVKPGITGLWQISQCRAEPIHCNPQYDLYYINNHNVMLDIAIILRTVSAVIRGMGAV
jgi:lipopolysaccharide/colanic/teichoic acid biosynthesis glycosyltransferase